MITEIQKSFISMCFCKWIEQKRNSKLKLLKNKNKHSDTLFFFSSVWNGDRQTFIRGRLSKENNVDQKLLPLILSQRKRFKSNEMIIVVINEIIKRLVYTWAYGPGGRGGLQPPQILGNSDFLGSTRKFGQSQFLKTSPCFYYYFEEINIFYFNLKSA